MQGGNTKTCQVDSSCSRRLVGDKDLCIWNHSKQEYLQEAPNNIVSSLPHKHSEVDKIILDSGNVRIFREAGHSAEPESIHRIWKSREEFCRHQLGQGNSKNANLYLRELQMVILRVEFILKPSTDLDGCVSQVKSIIGFKSGSIYVFHISQSF